MEIIDVENIKPANIILRPATTPGPVKKKSVIVSTPGHVTPARCISARTPALNCSRMQEYVLNTPGSCLSIKSASRENARIAKLQNTTEKMNKVAELKEKWAKEKEAKQLQFQEKRSAEKNALANSVQKAAEMRKRAAKIQQQAAQKQSDYEKDLLLSSVEARKQLAEDLAVQKKQKRRESIKTNKAILRMNKKKQDEITRKKKEEEDSLLLSRRIDFLQVREAKKIAEDRSRESLCERGRIAQQQREVEDSLSRQKAEEEKSLIEFRRKVWEAKNEDLKEMADARRKSMEGRLEAWRQQRSVHQSMAEEEMEMEKSWLGSRRDNWIEMNNYKREEENKRRESLAMRLDQWREQRAQSMRELTEAQEAAEIEWQLKQQELDDVRNYHESLAQERRESLAFRLEKARKDKETERAMENTRLILEEEEKRLAQQDREDVERHRRQVIEARRKSLEVRGEQMLLLRQREEADRQEQRDREEADFRLREEDWLAVKKYQEEEREKARKSIAERLIVARKHHENDLANHRAQLDQLHEECMRKRTDWQDVQRSQEENRQRSRLSVALRLDGWRRERMVEEMRHRQRVVEAEEEARMREQDREAVLAAKKAFLSYLQRDQLECRMVH